MNINTQYIVEKITELSRIPSLSGNEKEFLAYLKQDIEPKTRKYTCHDYGKYLLVKYHKPSPFLVLVHIDRIRVPGFTFKILEGGYLKGQLDNCISVAIAKLLINKEVPVNFCFTTQEEVLQSNNQIIEAYHLDGYKYALDLDIDVTVKSEEVKQGCISLRDHDSIGKYDELLVNKMRALAAKYKVDYITKDKDWLVCQIGTTIQQDKTVRGMYLGLPIDSYHSNHEVINFRCISQMIKLFMGIKKEYKTG